MGQAPQMPRPSDSRAGDERDRLYRFLRYSHIFSAVAREILEIRYLSEVTREPLTLAQFHLLRLITQDGKNQLGKMAECVGVSAPAASMNLDKLERLNLASREPDTEDRRAIRLAVSPQGRDLVERYESLVTGRVRTVLGALTPEEVETLTGLLERVAVAFLEQERPAGESCLRCAAYGATPCPVHRVLQTCAYVKLHANRCPEGTAEEVTP